MDYKPKEVKITEKGKWVTIGRVWVGEKTEFGRTKSGDIRELQQHSKTMKIRLV